MQTQKDILNLTRLEIGRNQHLIWVKLWQEIDELIERHLKGSAKPTEPEKEVDLTKEIEKQDPRKPKNRGAKLRILKNSSKKPT